MNEPMHRFKYTKLTIEQVGQKLVPTAAGPKCVSDLSDALAGKSLKIVTDNGPVLNYSFKSKNKLTLAEGSGAAVECGYGALPLKSLVFFSHMIPKTPRGFNVFVDLNTNLVTVFEVWLCSDAKEVTMSKKEYTMDPREVQRQIYFGYVDVPGKEAPKKRHSTTNRIEGTGMYWKQDGNRDPGFVSFGLLHELCRTHPACRRPQLLRPVGLRNGQRQHFYLPTDRM